MNEQSQDQNERENLSGSEPSAYFQCSHKQTPHWAAENRRILSEFEALQDAIRGKPITHNEKEQHHG
jgi:hypothetical protein